MSVIGLALVCALNGVFNIAVPTLETKPSTLTHPRLPDRELVVQPNPQALQERPPDPNANPNPDTNANPNAYFLTLTLT